tara:strand:- start:7318 stop:7878 length:561 start_codon:yes stop_codon:yes gene_type:complete
MAKSIYYAKPREITQPDGTTGTSRPIGVSAEAIEERIKQQKADQEAGIVINTMAPPHVIKKFENILGEKIQPGDSYNDIVKRVLAIQKEKEAPVEDEAISLGMKPSAEQLAEFMGKRKAPKKKSAEVPTLTEEIKSVMGGTVAALEDLLASGAGDNFLSLIQAHEVENKNRSTALTVIENRMKEVM